MTPKETVETFETIGEALFMISVSLEIALEKVKKLNVDKRELYTRIAEEKGLCRVCWYRKADERYDGICEECFDTKLASKIEGGII